ncbi:ABC transporter ATP-binding protein/permease [Patescibacteria group bacterium]|jgi:ATP-binding cassette subfamily B protein|nr:ABC transporter ATP-binding protein/permease [Patescibacteria group bacterium]
MNTKPTKPTSSLTGLRKLLPFLKVERGNLAWAALFILVTSTINLGAPFVFGYAVDNFIAKGDYPGVLVTVGVMLAAYLISLGTQYSQMWFMGGVGQRVLFRLRSLIFGKLQQLSIAFFNRQKAGDLISRINNDTDKLNQFFAETLVRFVGTIVIMAGTSIFLLSLNVKLGLAAMAPAVVLLAYTRLLSPWVKSRTAASLKAMGGLSGEVQESLDHFKVIVAFDRRDYFRKQFEIANETNYRAALRAGVANASYSPVYDFASSFAQLIVVVYGLFLISHGAMTIGLLLSFLLYINQFYGPLRQIAMLWQSFQTALAAWDRISEILEQDPGMGKTKAKAQASSAVLEFRGVSFRYSDSGDVLKDISFALERGKTYALVGPTGGGKTTTASLMARLYDPTEGAVLLGGRDLRSYSNEERTKKIGFILQEPFLFSGTVLDNIFYGNTEYAKASHEEKVNALKENRLDGLMARFSEGVDTPVQAGAETISLGQRQLIAFMRAVLRKPELLILDEATANIDTVTEQSLEEVLRQLPEETTRVIIAHRLNTIESADGIFFVNGGKIEGAGSLQQAVDMLMHGKRQS